QYPWIRFDYDEKDKLHRLACEVDNISFAYEGMDKPLINRFSIAIEAGEKIAIIGENGVGKTTLLKLLMGELQLQKGTIKWAEKAKPGSYPHDHSSDFAEYVRLTDWIAPSSPITAAATGEDNETLLRGPLGRLLFSGDEVKKSAKVKSGGE